MSAWSMEKSFAAAPDQIAAAVAFIAAGGEDAGLAPGSLVKLQLVVEEAVTNICSYAYPECAGTFDVKVEGDARQVTVIITDEGRPFNPLEVGRPDLSLEADERPIGGLGVFLIRQFVDEIGYERINHRNVLRMKVEIKAEGQ